MGIDELEAKDITEGHKLRVVDLVEQGVRLYGSYERLSFVANREVKEGDADWRFELWYGDGGNITFHQDATAEDVARDIEDQRRRLLSTMP